MVVRKKTTVRMHMRLTTRLCGSVVVSIHLKRARQPLVTQMITILQDFQAWITCHFIVPQATSQPRPPNLHLHPNSDSTPVHVTPRQVNVPNPHSASPSLTPTHPTSAHSPPPPPPPPPPPGGPKHLSSISLQSTSDLPPPSPLHHNPPQLTASYFISALSHPI